MDFRILGPLEALDEGRGVALGGSKQRALLGLLLLHANQTLSTDRLIDELWGEHPPATAAKTVQVHVSRLRKALASGVPDDSGGMLVTRGHGYELQLDPDRLDAHRFERLVGEGRSELARGRPQGAASALEEALSLWRGRPLDDLAYEPFAQAEIARLDDLRIAALEQLIEAKLALGRHAEVVAQLETLIADHPYRERLRAQLMLALYRCDRQADALQAYQDARRMLVDELGIEPGERLRELERAVLAQDPGLALPAPAPEVDEEGREPDEAPPAAAAATAELPTGVVTFLLTDIEGSSGLWEQDVEGMAAALERHDQLIAEAARAHGGRLLKTKGEGDATLAVFPRASDGVACAVELQQTLLGTAWPGGLDLRVRIALHTGEAHERDGDYFGPALNRAARLRAIAAGGATVMSQATTEIVHDRLPPEVDLVDLGRQELRGLSRPENVFELRPAAGRGAPAPPAPPEVRKTVTVLFAGVVNLDREGPRLDAEARRRLVERCFARMRAALERHGGTVETYPGDALMAVFGVPLLHEDDALRAVRAAAEIRAALPSLEDELEEAFGVRLTARLGVATGEVIAAPPDAAHSIATGEAVNVARCLEEGADAGDVLMDRETHGLVRDSVRAEGSGRRSLSSGEEIAALRLVEVREAGGRVSRLASPLVGRDRELVALSTQFSAAVREQTCHLVTVLGSAGVGKSRLVDEFIGRLGEEASVLRGRCLSYGDGITYWPLAEVIRDLAGGHGELSPAAIAEQLAEEPKADLIAAGVAEALGLAGSLGGTSEQTFWAVRRLLEAVARRRPLVVVFDDLQWAEPTFLDLVEHVADLSRAAPILLLCVARPELLDVRPGWGGGKLNATSALLAPLSVDESRQLVANLLSLEPIAADGAARIADAAEGNPLFVEELLAMAIDDGLLQPEEGGWTAAGELADLPVPPTIHALLAARLERLPGEERALLALASVEGAVFHRGAVDALAPEALVPAVERSLTSLVRRELIRPDRSSFADDEAFQFRHALIRDAAYRSLPKEARAELHAEFAAWLERTAGPRLQEFEEIAGYHLEQAYRFLSELAPAGADTAAVGGRGAARLESAGRRALARSDLPGAINLLERAAAMLRDEPARHARLLPEIGAALIEAGRFGEAERGLADAIRVAAAGGDEGAGAHARVQEQFLRLRRGQSRDTSEAAGVVDAVVPVFTRDGDELGLCRALRLRAWLHWTEAQADDALVGWEKAAGHARLAGADHERIDILGWIASCFFFGPTPVAEGIRRCEAIRDEVGGDPTAVARALRPLAGLHAMEGRFDRARELLASSTAAFEELGLTLTSAVSHHGAMVELLAGDPAAAERGLRKGFGVLEEMGDTSMLSTTAAFLAQTLLAQGRYEEAEHFAHVSQTLAADDDLLTQVLWRGVRARTLAESGSIDEAERVAWHAVLLAEKSDFVNHRAEALADLGVVLQRAGKPHEAHDQLSEALRLYEEKGNAVAAKRARAELLEVSRRG